MKTCSKCGETKPLSEYYYKKDNKDKLSTACKNCCLKYAKVNYQNKAEQKRKKSVEYYYKNRESCNEKAKAYREKHKNKYSDYYSTYKKQKRDYYNHLNSLRQLRKTKACPKWLTKEEILEIKKEYSLARWCSDVMKEVYHVDHIVPLQGKNVCGLHVPWNLQVIPATENIKKGNRHDT